MQQIASFSAKAPNAVEVIGLRRAFGERTIIDNLDLEVVPGQLVALLGASGCGKTTLLRTLAGLDRPEGGIVSVPDALAVVFQEPRLLPWRPVWRNVLLGLPARKERAVEVLAEVGLAGRVDAWPETLSGGEAQRTALARALVRKPQLLLLDEPFAALDALTRIKMHDLVLDLWRKYQPAVVLVTHDVDEAVLLSDRILVMKEGRIARDVSNGLTRPRSRRDPQFENLRSQLLEDLGVAVDGRRDNRP